MSHKVLVVEDDPVLLRMVCRYLARRAFVVESAVDGEEALEKVVAFQPDLVLSDVRMPRMDGTALLAALKARDGDGTIVTQSDGWTIINEPLASAQWSFVPSGHEAHPAVVRRILRRAAGGAPLCWRDKVGGVLCAAK